MQRILLSATLFAVLLGAGASSAQEIIKIREDQKANVELISKMQGKWLLDGLERNGQGASEAEIRGARVLIREDRIVFTHSNGDAMIMRFTVDANKKTKEIDLATREPMDAKFLGIIEFDGERLRFAFRNGPGKRPTTFRGEDNRDVTSFALRRTK